jgi:ABC-2 type transport system ATP-binding protein
VTAVIDIDGLRKTYRRLRGRRLALDGLRLRVEPGQVHGLVGPNGSGKTTAVHALLGLVRADAGEMRIFGQPVPQRLPALAHRIGAVVARPGFSGDATGRRTLELLATAGGVPVTRVGGVLEQLDLREQGDEPVRSYSPGIRQRLAIAAALLRSPELLILDEPTNGLDPAGSRQVRAILRGLGTAGVTMLVSSQLLPEIEQLCQAVTVISRGRQVTSGPVAEVLAGHDRGEFRVRVDDLDRAVAIIAETGLPVTSYGDHLIVGDLADASWLSRTLGRHGLWVSELTPLAPSLEQVLLGLTGTAAAPVQRRRDGDAVSPPPRPAAEVPPDGRQAPA